jgi:hypothetical protein
MAREVGGHTYHARVEADTDSPACMRTPSVCLASEEAHCSTTKCMSEDRRIKQRKKQPAILSPHSHMSHALSDLFTPNRRQMVLCALDRTQHYRIDRPDPGLPK